MIKHNKVKRIIKIFIFVLIVFIFFEKQVYSINEVNNILMEQEEIIDTENFMTESQKYIDTSFEGLNLKEIFSNLISGKLEGKSILEILKDKVLEEIKNVSYIISTISVIVIIHSLFKIISDNLENDSVSKIAYLVQYIMIVVFLVNIYSEVIDYIKEAIQNAVVYSYMFIPILVSICVSTGRYVSGTIAEPIILYFISITGNIISTIIIPLLLISTTFSIISNISDEIDLDRISKFLKSFSIGTLIFILTIFTGLLSMQTLITKSTDDLAIKGTKNVVSNAVPVVRQSIK